ncbi:sigma-54-dependent transcriptional regulator [Pseudomonas oryzae]|uniref:Sigma-54 specific transcriptional regulator, flagellar regulatory protein A n=1 Tax=Pseudomonas oryzae TaxID=1392877 RepID=A0A1H1M0X3_9PSED|nr:sigma-54 dependent transcriptional regulator [Pseudomonas oryzae]SDR80474.1 sigma-54 specific transcriptional regulator, flagellar regulatory protein A [Pseudomonas oryzae]
MWRESRILLIDDNPQRRHDLVVIFEFLGEACSSGTSTEVVAGLPAEELAQLSCVLLGQVDSKGGVPRLLKQLGAPAANLPLLLIGEQSTLDWSEDLRRRVLARLDMPPSYNQLLDSLHRAQVYLQVYDVAIERGLQRESNLFRSLVGTSRAILQVRQQMQQVAGTEVGVLLLGEAGTGKEVVARNLHYHSARREFPFVPFSCTAIDPELLDSELFGYEEGAFPGAIASRRGRLELANGGTLYIDEVADLPAELQVRLLRVLQEGSFKRLGSDQVHPVDVRLIAASRHDLDRRVAEGSFRDDLYYRLNQFSIELPPLRERVEDIPLLLNELIARLEHEKRGSIRFSSAALMSLCRHDWRGNVRELANLVERLAIMHPYGVIGVGELPKKFRHIEEEVTLAGNVVAEQGSSVLPPGALPGLDVPALLPVGGLDLKDYLNNLERSLIQQALDDAGGVVARAAERLRVRRTTLVEKMRKYGMGRRDDDEGDLA